MAAYPIPADLGAVAQPISLSADGKKRATLICEHIAKCVAFSLACELAGVPYSTACAWRQRSPEFQAMLAAAEERRTQLLEAEAWRRAIGGSDTMLIFMLKAARPATYRENHSIELTGPGGAPLELSDPQRAARIAALLAAMRNKQERAAESGTVVDGEYREVAPPADDGSDLL